jgi:hypothetical protein
VPTEWSGASAGGLSRSGSCSSGYFAVQDIVPLLSMAWNR